jgi:hypothetical protein
MTDPTIKNCSTCGHSTPGDYSTQEGKDRHRYCNLCSSPCWVVNSPLTSETNWACVRINQWVPQPPEPPEPLTIWQQVGKAIHAKLTHGDSK